MRPGPSPVCTTHHTISPRRAMSVRHSAYSWPVLIADLDALTETEVEQDSGRFLLRAAPRPGRQPCRTRRWRRAAANRPSCRRSLITATKRVVPSRRNGANCRAHSITCQRDCLAPWRTGDETPASALGHGQPTSSVPVLEAMSFIQRTIAASALPNPRGHSQSTSTRTPSSGDGASHARFS
jgi:hypothetical protein